MIQYQVMWKRTILMTAALAAGLLGCPWIPLSPSAVRGEVYVSDSTDALQLLDAARRLTEDEQHAEAAKTIQKALDEHGASILKEEANSYGQVHRVAGKMLRGNAPLLGAYRRMYEATAVRQLELAGANEDKLVSVWRRFGQTNAGLDAAMRLVGLKLEANQPEAAGILLQWAEGHPGAATNALRLAQLRAVAGLLEGDGAKYQENLEKLIEAAGKPGGPVQMELESLAGRVKARRAPVSLSPLDETGPANLPVKLDKPIWRAGYTNPIREEFSTKIGVQGQLGEMAESGWFLNVLPVVQGADVLINTGAMVQALDRESGMVVWQYSAPNGGDFQYVQVSDYQRLLGGADAGRLSATEDRVIAIVGLTTTVPVGQLVTNQPANMLVCLDRHDGKIKWSSQQQEVDEDVGTTFWYGRPVIVQDRVYMTSRTRQTSGFIDCHVQALSLRDGRVIWKRHIASTVIKRGQSILAFKDMLYEDGWLYIDSALGGLAKISAADGDVAWLTTLDNEEGAGIEVSRMLWHADSPLLVQAGLVILDNWSQVVRLVDPQTGRVIRSFGTPEWDEPIFLMKAGPDLLAVGQKVLRLKGADLTLKWKAILERSPTGRPALAGNVLHIPVGQRIVAMDIEKGVVQTRLDNVETGNVLALEGQLFIAQTRQMLCHTTRESSLERLAKRIKADPKDINPLLSMAWLSFNARLQEPLIQTLERSSELLARDPANKGGRRKMFNLLMQMTQEEDLADVSLKEKIYSYLASSSDSPDEEVAYRMSLGRFYDGTMRPEHAAEQYQAILSQPEFRGRLYRDPLGARQAGLEAQGRLEKLIKTHGRKVVEQFDAFASMRLDELKNQNSPQPLLELSRAYPLSPAAWQALLLAGERYAAQDNPRAAIRLLRQASGMATEPKAAAQVYSRQAELYVTMKQPLKARRVLRILLSRYPQEMATFQGKQVDPRQWYSLLEERGGPGLGDPKIGALKTTGQQYLEGTLLEATLAPERQWNLPYVLLRSDTELSAISWGDLKTLWRRPVREETLDLLAAERDYLWVQNVDSRSIQLLDSQTGKVRMETGPIDQLLSSIRVLGAEENQAREIGRGDRSQLMESSGGMLAVADTTGRVAVFSAEEGRTLWQAATELRYVSRMTMDDWFLILTGIDQAGERMIMVHDIDTGRLVRRITPPGGQAPRTMALTEDGYLLVVAQFQVTLLDPFQDRTLWSTRYNNLQSRLWLEGDTALLMSQSGVETDLLLIQVSTGKLLRTLPKVMRNATERLGVVGSPRGWYVQVGDRYIMSLDRAGNIIWRDSVSDGPNFQTMSLSEKHVVVTNVVEHGFNDRMSLYRMYLMDRQGGAVVDEVLLKGEDGPRMVVVGEGQVLISTRNNTVVLQAPASAPSPGK